MDLIVTLWFALTALSAAYVGYDLWTNTPEMRVMKWGWLLVTLYAGPVAFAIYWVSCRQPSPDTHDAFIAPLWKQAVGSTIHCLAGDATGIIVAAALTAWLGLPMGIDAAVEYAAGFAVGLLVFQALFMKDVLRVSYRRAVAATWYAEWVSMNAVMAGMIPVMVILMSRDMQSMEPSSGRFWAVMSLATVVGALPAFPVNVWLVKKRLKHGMGTERALGKGGVATAAQHGAMDMPAMGMTHLTEGDAAPPSRAARLAVACVTLVLLLAGVLVAARFGDLAMRRDGMTMPMHRMSAHQHSRRATASIAFSPAPNRAIDSR